MKKTAGIVAIAAVLLSALSLPLTASASIIRTSGIEISGTVRANGAAAPIGTVIDVIADGVEITDYELKEAGSYRLTINPAEAKAGDSVTLRVGGITAGTFILVGGGIYDLSVTGQVKGESDTAVGDGDIIQCKNSSDPFAVYIVKITQGKKYIRHIVSLEIFNHYQHLRWENLIQVESLDGYVLSGWVRLNSGPEGTPLPQDRIWEVNGDQTRHWIDMTAEEFLLHGGSEEAIFPVNLAEMILYKMGPAVKLI